MIDKVKVSSTTQTGILITRPDPQGKELCALVQALGNCAFHLPTLIFAPPTDNQRFHENIQKLNQQEWLIFNSPQAVYATTSVIKHYWPIFPSQIRMAAIGEGTKNALLLAGYQNEIIQPKTNWNSEGLLSLPEFQIVLNKKIAIVKGEGGRDILSKVLSERGAIVFSINAYQRVLPDIEMREYEVLLEKGAIHIVVCTSFESVRNLKSLLSSRGWDSIKLLPLVVASERIKILAQGLGFQTIWVARNASHDAILQILKSEGKA